MIEKATKTGEKANKGSGRNPFLIIAAGFGLLLLLIIGGFTFYVNDYYHSDPEVDEMIASIMEESGKKTDSNQDVNSDDTTNNDDKISDGSNTQQAEAITTAAPSITLTSDEKDNLVFTPAPSQDQKIGFIFYPGGKVDYKAYAPLMKQLAENGITCILMKMPLNLAILDTDRAQGIPEEYPQITAWYIGGHSLGGACAAMYLEEEEKDQKEDQDPKANYLGLVLLGSYSSVDLSQSDLKVLCIYGSEDQVMKQESYQEDKAKLPADFEEFIIEGGCHAGFGNYGAQEGDGQPFISNEEQQKITIEQMKKWMGY